MVIASRSNENFQGQMIRGDEQTLLNIKKLNISLEKVLQLELEGYI